MREAQFKINNGSTPLNEAVDSQLKPKNKKLKKFKVVVRQPYLDDAVSLRALTVAAAGRRDAMRLATLIVNGLSDEQIEDISVDVAGGLLETVICFVAPTNLAVGHVWTREEIESEDFDSIVEKEAKVLRFGQGE